MQGYTFALLTNLRKDHLGQFKFQVSLFPLHEIKVMVTGI